MGGDSEEHKAEEEEVEKRKDESLVMQFCASAKSDELGKTSDGKVGRRSVSGSGQTFSRGSSLT